MSKSKKSVVKNTTKTFDDNDLEVKTNKDNIDLLAGVYVRARRKLSEQEYGHYYYSDSVISDSQKIVYHIDSVIDAMDDKAKLILENEIKLNRKGEWFRDYCSPTTYYKIRGKIYSDFLKELDK